MELKQTRPLSIVILQDGVRLFAETTKDQIAIDSEKNWFLSIQGNMISTVKGNIRTIRDATDPEYYEFFILDKLPPPVIERMHEALAKIHAINKPISLMAIISYQKRIEEELSQKRWWLTPEEKENRRYNVMRMNEILVTRWFFKQIDADRIMLKILTPA